MDEERFESAETDAIRCSDEDGGWIRGSGEECGVFLGDCFERGHFGLCFWKKTVFDVFLMLICG